MQGLQGRRDPRAAQRLLQQVAGRAPRARPLRLQLRRLQHPQEVPGQGQEAVRRIKASLEIHSQTSSVFASQAHYTKPLAKKIRLFQLILRMVISNKDAFVVLYNSTRTLLIVHYATRISIYASNSKKGVVKKFKALYIPG